MWYDTFEASYFASLNELNIAGSFEHQNAMLRLLRETPQLETLRWRSFPGQGVQEAAQTHLGTTLVPHLATLELQDVSLRLLAVSEDKGFLSYLELPSLVRLDITVSKQIQGKQYIDLLCGFLERRVPKLQDLRFAYLPPNFLDAGQPLGSRLESFAIANATAEDINGVLQELPPLPAEEPVGEEADQPLSPSIRSALARRLRPSAQKVRQTEWIGDHFVEDMIDALFVAPEGAETSAPVCEDITASNKDYVAIHSLFSMMAKQSIPGRRTFVYVERADSATG